MIFVGNITKQKAAAAYLAREFDNCQPHDDLDQRIDQTHARTHDRNGNAKCQAKCFGLNVPLK